MRALNDRTPMSPSSLFRIEALNANRVAWLGEVILARPISLLLLTLMAVLMALLTVGFLICGTYTKRSTVIGQLVPDLGILKIHAPQSGVILEKYVAEGQTIRKGERLFLISSERQNSNAYGIQAAISGQVATREQSLRDELTQTRTLQRDEESALRKKIDGLVAEQVHVVSQLTGQSLRVGLAEAAVSRATQLLAQGYISEEMTQQKQADLLDQRNRMQSLERDKMSITRELESRSAELASMPLRQHQQLAQVERLLTTTQQEWTESEGKRRVAITAPESGVATAVTAEAGQTVDSNRNLVNIIPSGAVLQAHLYAPSRAIGFIKPGDTVLLRYQAYPYQKFSHARGTVTSVSRAAISSSEIATIQNAPVNSGEALYRITVSLARQSITAYGKPHPLQAGMLIDADILLEKRKLYEWVLEPLFGLTGKL